ncbi:MAG TPA: encapsulin [Bacillota bacterium]|nr:encapsulin [Bacillota bacterium]HQD86986.1 encapsulin [Bacillota bacterium]
MDYILNGKGYGDIADILIANDFDPGVLRPYIGQGGRSFVNRNGKAVVTNTPATLLKDEWIQLDTAVIKAATPRLKFVADVRARGLTYNIPNGMGKTVLQSQNVGDINDAVISMDGLKRGENDRPHFDIENLPLPIIHKDWFFSARELAASRNGGSPLDTTMAELAGRKVAESVEKLALGQLATYTFGGGTIYGLSNTPHALSKTLTAPTDSGWTPKTLVEEILEMRKQSQDAFHYGPWVLYFAPAWDIYLDQDYSDNKGDITLRQRIQQITGISAVTTLDYMPDYDVAMVQMTSDVVRMVVGMDIINIQWDTNGGLQKNFKTMCIIVPQFRADQNGNTGIVYGKV